MSKKRPEIRIRDVSQSLKNDLIAIAKNKGFESLSYFCKIELRKVRDSYPDKFKEMPKED